LIDKTPLALSDEFKSILEQLETDSQHFFITGKAGTGKSTLLQLFRNTTKKRTAILAPTGIAALNVKGQTIHSFFGFPPRMINPEDIRKRPNHRMYKNIDCIIIDEISMVRADTMDNIDLFLRRNRDSDLPFGGVQMLFFGDLYQLPPVISSPFEKNYFHEVYESGYFFSSVVVKEKIQLRLCELHHIYRQDELKFIRLLDAIRNNDLDWDDLESLNARNLPLPEDLKYFITICATNSSAETINRTALEKLKSEEKTYAAEITGEFASQYYPTDPILQLKVGAQVMFVKNDVKRLYVNGTIGQISRIEKNEVYITILEGHESEVEIQVEKEEWEIIKYVRNEANPRDIQTEIVGKFLQYPIKLAWAITIHKSQGKTFEKVIIDLGRGAFEYGQTYVALSRCRTMDGIYLKNKLQARDVMTDQAVQDYFDQIKRW